MNDAANKNDEMAAGELHSRVFALECQLERVLERNRRVELNKAWESSGTRLLSVTIVTYVTMILVFTVLGSARPLLDALVPTTGFFLSTLTLPVARRVWEKWKSEKAK